jgi:type I restriction enzyme S subunit
MIIQENLPNNWEYLPIRSIFTESDTRCGDNQYDLLSVTQDRGIIKQSDVDIKKDISNDDKSKYKVVLKDSISYNKMRMWQGAVGINEIDEGIVSPAYVVINPTKEMNTKFYYYLFKTPYMISQFGKYSYGLVDDMNSLRYDDFQKIYIPIPPIEEQNQIVNFIDKKSVQIEKFIQNKTRFIELLKEQKEAVINEAVTKGLDNTVEFKDSEIDVIGSIPTHWLVPKLKFISKSVLGKMLCNIDKGNYQLKPYLKSKNIQWMNVNTEVVEEMWFSENELKLYRIKKDDLLLSEGGEVGKTCIWNDELDECYIQNSVHKVTLNKENYPKYFLYLFFTLGKLKFFDSIVNRVSIAHLVLEKLINIDVLQPPLEEQKQIVEHIENELNQIDNLIEKTTKEIELIKEYKTSLINEAVSGKIKVG